jgi:hypothetical protein
MPAAAQVECLFDRLSTVQGLDQLDGHAFRVVPTSAGLTLEQRYADGTWLPHGEVVETVTPDFVVYQHLPPAEGGVVSVLTIHRSGSASLMTHHGSFGNATLQYRRAWLYHGECTATVAGQRQG